MYSRITLFFLFCLCFFGLKAQNEVVVTDGDLVAGEDYTWESDKIYILDGIVAVKAGSKLTIEAGTIVKALPTPVLGGGNGATTSALLVAQGAQIFALGEPNNPVVFTSSLDDTSLPEDLTYLDRGLWGGVIICGTAPIGNFESPSTLEIAPLNLPASYGGESEDDNSGVFQYVSIRHAGASVTVDVELNGLTLAGIGNKTVIDHIEVFAGQDDGIAIIGGTVNLKYLNSSFNADDAFDFDEAWTGKGQFWFGILDKEGEGTALEGDGTRGDDSDIFSKPQLYNLTFIGQGSELENDVDRFSRSIYLRDASGGTLANSVFIEFPNNGLQIEDLPANNGVDSRQRIEDGDLEILNNIWWAIGSRTEFSTGDDGILGTRGTEEDSTAQFLIDHLVANQNSITDPRLNDIDWANSGTLDPRPAIDGPAYQNLASYPDDDFFTEVPYKGAFGQNAEWLFSWSALDEYEMVSAAFSSQTTSAQEVILATDQIQIYPNPVSNQMTLKTAIGFDAQQVNLRLTDIMGREIWNRSEQLSSATQIELSMEGINAGNYYLQVIGEKQIYVLPVVKIER
ncbi:MAG: T9SS type A sorting domain-containing protein [Bacteroidota bacterium]